MPRPPNALVATLIAAAAVTPACGGGRDGGAVPGPGGSVDARVERVVDGDTVVARLAGGERERVRYIGIDTPESVRPGTPVQCFAEAASARNSALVEGRPVILRLDAERRDRYGRLLAYVYRRPDGLFVNAALVGEGYAETLRIPPNTAHAGELGRLERAARRRLAGLWGACPAAR